MKDFARNEFASFEFHVERDRSARLYVVKGKDFRLSHTRFQMPMYFTGEQIVCDIVSVTRAPEPEKTVWAKRVPLEILRPLYLETLKGFLTFGIKEDAPQIDWSLYIVDYRDVKMPSAYRDMVDEALRARR